MDVIVTTKSKIENIFSKQDLWDSGKKLEEFAREIIEEESLIGLVDELKVDSITMDYTPEFTNLEIINKYLKSGHLITCNRCGAELAEFIYKGSDGNSMIGEPTDDTKKYTLAKETDYGICWKNITHINRTEISAIPYLRDSD